MDLITFPKFSPETLAMIKLLLVAQGALLVVILIVLTINKMLAGARAKRHVYREMKELAKYLNESRALVKHFEKIISERVFAVPGRAKDTLTDVKKVLAGMENRFREVKSHLDHGSGIDVAFSLLSTSLMTQLDTVDNVVGREPFPDLRLHECPARLESLFAEVNLELQKEVRVEKKRKAFRAA